MAWRLSTRISRGADIPGTPGPVKLQAELGCSGFFRPAFVEGGQQHPDRAGFVDSGNRVERIVGGIHRQPPAAFEAVQERQGVQYRLRNRRFGEKAETSLKMMVVSCPEMIADGEKIGAGHLFIQKNPIRLDEERGIGDGIEPGVAHGAGIVLGNVYRTIFHRRVFRRNPAHPADVSGEGFPWNR